MKTSTKLHKWKQSRTGLLVSAVVELLVAYGLGSWGLDTGSWWLYLFTLIFLVGGIKNLIKLVKVLIHGQQPKNSKA